MEMEKEIVYGVVIVYGVSDGYVTDDVTWSWKVKFVTPIRLEPNISKTAGFRDSDPKEHQ